MQKNILIVVGTRPNFIKITQFKKVARNYPNFNVKIVHTSQHYSDEMSKNFFESFDLYPDYFISIPTNLTVVAQMAEIMKGLEHLINTAFHPHLIIVVGDVNSTLAGSLVANKLNIPLAHLESGLRSFDYTMPEEYNRILTDKMAHYFFVTGSDAVNNLKYESVRKDRIFFVGNTMIDTLIAYQYQIDSSPILEELKITAKKYILLTLHRPANVDTPNGLNQIIDLIQSIHKNYSDTIKNIVFPIHPRTENNFKKYQLWDKLNAISSLVVTKPQSYFNFQKLIKHTLIVITDSGGVQEETSYLGIPCITLRSCTERPVTLWQGSNILLAFNENTICKYIHFFIHPATSQPQHPDKWDGKSTERIFEVLVKILL